jgi:uncharacterized protein
VSDHPNNLQIAREAYVLVGAGNLQGFLNLLTHDIDWRFFVSGIPARESSFRGRDAVEEYLKTIFGALEVQFFPAEFITDTNCVVVLGHESVRVRSNGKTFDANWAHIFNFRDGLIAGFREYSDSIDRPDQR